MRSLGVCVISAALSAVVIANAFYQKKQFYPSVVYITRSNPSMAVMYIQAFIVAFITGNLVRKVFFGELRTSEFEHLMERSWYAITETLLAFTVFRDDLSPSFVAMFTLLLFLKSFHWLAEDRVDFMERSPVISYLFHIRVVSLILVLGLLDIQSVGHAYRSVMGAGASVQLVFGFEYAILITTVVNIAVKYILHVVDLHRETPWENKAVYLLYTEVIVGFNKVILYIVFMIIMVKIYTLPLFALRPMYFTMRSFKNAFQDVIQSRRAIRNMNTLYPDATAEELQAGDNVCIICREEMTSAAKKLPCNHIFHAACLRSWFQRQQTCPTCRLNILRSTPNVTPTPPPPPPPQARNNPINMIFRNPFMMLNNNNVPGGGPVPPPGAGEQANEHQPQQQPAAGGGIPPPGSIPPFLPFPPMPFMAPPPMPPPNLANMSTEQLRRMEGNEREHVEARIQWLKNIQLMLDSAVLMMQQYNTAAAISLSMPNASPPPAETAVPSQPQPTPSAPASTATEPSPEAAPSQPAPSTSSADDSQSSISTVDEQLPGPSTSSAASSYACEGREDSPESEVRRRRLEKFLQAEQ